MSLFGSALAGPAGMLGLGLLGAYTDVERAEEALAEEYGVNPPGYPRGYDPELSTFGAFLDAVTSVFGESAAKQVADEMSHMAVAGLEGIGYGGFGVPGVAEAKAAADWGGFETDPGPTTTEMAAAMEDAYGGYGVFGGFGPPGASAIGGEGPSGGEGAGSAGAGGKIACTMMNHLYGYDPYRKAAWKRFMDEFKTAPEWELGYHKIYAPWVAKMPTSAFIRWWLEPVIAVRQGAIKNDLAGRPRTFWQNVYHYTLPPIVYATGWLVRRGFLKKANLEPLHKIWRGGNVGR